MKKLYSNWDSEGNFTHCSYYEESQKPENALELLPDGFVKPKLIDGTIIESATESEITEHNNQFLPKIVSQRQLRTQLVLNGFDLNSVQLAINDLSEPNKSIAQIAWDYAITFERDSPLLVCLGANLGLSQTDIDNIFLNASKL